MLLTIRFLQYLLFLAVDLAMTWVVAPILVNWWAPVFAESSKYLDRGLSKTGDKLPIWLAWFDTFDADLDQGVRDGSIQGRFPYWNRVMWLNRNRAYGLDYWPLGTAFLPADWRVVLYRVSSDSARWIFVAISKRGYFDLHVTGLGLQVKLGWKAWNYYVKETGQWNSVPWGPQWRVPFVFSISRA